jgi:hypothetical protein
VLRGVGPLLPMTVQPSAPGVGVAAGAGGVSCPITRDPEPNNNRARAEATPFMNLMIDPPERD